MTWEKIEMTEIKRKNRGGQKGLDPWVIRKRLNIQENTGKEEK